LLKKETPEFIPP